MSTRSSPWIDSTADLFSDPPISKKGTKTVNKYGLPYCILVDFNMHNIVYFLGPKQVVQIGEKIVDHNENFRFVSYCICAVTCVVYFIIVHTINNLF